MDGWLSSRSNVGISLFEQITHIFKLLLLLYLIRLYLLTWNETDPQFNHLVVELENFKDNVNNKEKKKKKIKNDKKSHNRKIPSTMVVSVAVA